jgi:hypothetical protein
MKNFKSFRLIIFVLFASLSLIFSCNNQQKSTFSKADSTAVLQAIFDFQNADFDTVAAMSKRHTNDTITVFPNKTLKASYQLTYRGEPVVYTKINPSTVEMDVMKPRMALHFWHFKKNSIGDSVQVVFSIRDWGLTFDYRLAQDKAGWHVIGLGKSRGKLI